MVALTHIDELKDWENYRRFAKERLKQLAPEGGQVFISRTDVDFDIGGKSWSGRALFVGEKGVIAAKKIRKQGVLFSEGTCRLEGKQLFIEGIPAASVKKARKTLKKLVLGYEIAGLAEEADADDADDEDDEDEVLAADAGTADLGRKAEQIEKAVQVWKATERVATRQLRSLQKAVLALGVPEARGVIGGLERILTRLEKLDDVALAAAEAAGRGDAAGFADAQQRFERKLAKMLKYARDDELIADADANPGVEIKLRETLLKSLTGLLKAV